MNDAREDKAPRYHEETARSVAKGLIIVNTGDGKGKSTAGFGMVLRSLGRGYKVAVVQFIKGKWITGETKALKRFGRQIELHTLGTALRGKPRTWSRTRPRPSEPGRNASN